MKQNKKDNTLINSFLMDWVLQRILVSGCVLQASYGVSLSVLQCGTSRVGGVLATPVQTAGAPLQMPGGPFKVLAATNVPGSTPFTSTL